MGKTVKKPSKSTKKVDTNLLEVAKTKLEMQLLRVENSFLKKINKDIIMEACEAHREGTKEGIVKGVLYISILWMVLLFTVINNLK